MPSRQWAGKRGGGEAGRWFHTPLECIDRRIKIDSKQKKIGPLELSVISAPHQGTPTYIPQPGHLLQTAASHTKRTLSSRVQSERQSDGRLSVDTKSDSVLTTLRKSLDTCFTSPITLSED
jgi:hypothetical protein